ncbi:MAG: hypothetical protein QXM39_03360 [Thermoplasmata archaeon]
MSKEKKYPKAIYNCFEDERASLDLTLITNELYKTLKDGFEQLTKDYKFFDCFNYLISIVKIIILEE